MTAAERDWSTRAWVRITAKCTARRVGTGDDRVFEPGDELEMVQFGRRGGEVLRGTWWTSAWVIGACKLPAAVVEVLEVLADHPPTFAGAALPPAFVCGLFGQAARGWAAQGILVVADGSDFEIRAATGEPLGLVARDLSRDHYLLTPRLPLTYRVVVRCLTDQTSASRGEVVLCTPLPAGEIPADPAALAAARHVAWIAGLNDQISARRPDENRGVG